MSSNLVCILIDHRSIHCIDFREFRINSLKHFFYKSTKKNPYTLQSMESNHKNYASVQTELPIKLKFDMYIVDHHSLYYINFGVSRKYSFLQDTENIIHTLRLIGSKYLRAF